MSPLENQTLYNLTEDTLRKLCLPLNSLTGVSLSVINKLNKVVFQNLLMHVYITTFDLQTKNLFMNKIYQYIKTAIRKN